MVVKKLQNLGLRKLQGKVFHPEFESDLILAHVLRQDRGFLYAHPQKTLTAAQVKQFLRLLNSRKKGKPFAHILGTTSFLNLDIKVSSDVLAPRPETELLVEEALKIIISSKFSTVLDIGTGSGAIVISIVKNLDQIFKTKTLSLKYLASDISIKATKIAEFNAKKILGRKAKKIKFAIGSLLEPHLKNIEKPVLVVANLPYLKTSETNKAELKYEPKVSLDGGRDGLLLIKKLLREYKKMVSSGDYLLLEIGALQGPAIKKLIKKTIPESSIKIIKDYSGWDRVAKINVK